MGCHSSKVSATAEEIAEKRREIKSATRWWKRVRCCKTAPMLGMVESPPPRTHVVDSELFRVCRTESVELQIGSSSECLVDEITEQDPSVVSRPEVIDQPGRSTTTDDLVVEDIEDFSRVQFWASPPGSEMDLNQEGNMAEGNSKRNILDPATTDIPHTDVDPSSDGKNVEDNDRLSNCSSLLSKRDTSPLNTDREPRDCPEAALPVTNKTVLSDLSVPCVKGSLPNIFKLRRKKVRKASRSARDFQPKNESRAFSSNRSRTMSSQRVRRAPDLAVVQDVELPGIPQDSPNPEKICLDTWMKRRLKEEQEMEKK